MAPTGYSGTPLLKKLGINDQTKVLVLNAPDNYFELLEKGIRGQHCRKNEIPI